jgi:hypothetical protein
VTCLFIFWPYAYDPFWSTVAVPVRQYLCAGTLAGLDYGYGPDYYGFGYGRGIMVMPVQKFTTTCRRAHHLHVYLQQHDRTAGSPGA